MIAVSPPRSLVPRNACPHLFANPASCPLGHIHREDGVAPVRVFVEVVHGGCAHQLTPVKKVQSLLLGLHLIQKWR